MSFLPHWSQKWHCEDYVDRGEWKQPENVPKCFWFLLETFIWKGYKWQREDEKQVAKYVLKNAISLKRAFFSSKRIKLKEKVEVVKDLKSVVRASNSCQLIFRWRIHIGYFCNFYGTSSLADFYRDILDFFDQSFRSAWFCI